MGDVHHIAEPDLMARRSSPMDTDGTSAHRIDSDGLTVWVSAGRGECVGRFGRMGIDIHRRLGDQIAGGGECLECTHGPTGRPEWDRFKTAMVEHHGIEVPERHRPRHVPGEAR